MSEATTSPPPPTSRRPAFTVPKKAARRVKMLDKLADFIIRAGGTLVILAVAGIFIFIGKEAAPLFFPASAQTLLQASAPAFLKQAPSPVLGIDEYETYAYWLHPTGAIHLVELSSWKALRSIPIPLLQEHPWSAAYRGPTRDHLYIGTKDGHVLLAQMKFTPEYRPEGRTVAALPVAEKLIRVSEEGSAVTRIFGRHDTSGKAHFAVLTADGKIVIGAYLEGEDPKIETVAAPTLLGNITALAIDGEGRKLLVVTEDGRLHHWFLEEDREKPFASYRAGEGARRISAMEFAIGNNALLLGFNDGSVEEWFGVRKSPDDVLRPFQKIRSFDPLPAAVTAIQPSGRDKGFLAGGADGSVDLYFTTSGRTLLSLRADGPIESLCYAPKLTTVLATTGHQQAALWSIHNPHPEASWKAFFGKVWYEGYDRPEYTWQSTGGTDDFESKFSLVPLVLGTVKGALYGLFFAIPIAVMAAIYTSQFMNHRLRAFVKPAVEIMAALPSVVVGFLAGLWLAPLLENHVLSMAAVFLIVPILILIAVSMWHHLPVRVRIRIPHGTELALIVPLVAGGLLLAIQLGPQLESWFFQGDFRQWVFSVTGEQFEQRNSLVIGLAMGFAVIPIIFTISEDAMMNVPQHFISGSLALGASRWQTATRIILPTASPGIFSAVMVGFGRAVGETMIVLMATGNTPILSLSPFNGMRTLSANIAVEIPEAPLGGTLYRVLFLAAILLFLMTFAVNTVAEVIRQRLREKYKAV